MIPWSEKAKKIRKAGFFSVIFFILSTIFLYLAQNGNDIFSAGYDAIKYFYDVTEYLIFKGSFWEIQNVNFKAFFIGFMLSIALLGLFLCVLAFIEIYFILDKYGDSRVATKSDIQKMGLFTEKGINLILGKFRGKTITSSVCRHTMVVAPTRSGKTAGLVIPNILQFNGSQIIIDPKGELYQITGEAMKRKGYKVKCLDWSNPQSPDKWSPVDLKNLPTDIVELEKSTDRLAAALYPIGKGDNQFFDLQAKANFSSLMLYEILEARRLKIDKGIDKNISIASVLDFLNQAVASNAGEGDFPLGQTLCEYAKKAIAYDYPTRIIQDLNSWIQLGEKTAGNVAGTIVSKAREFRSEALKKTMEHSTFSFTDLRKEKTVLYIQFPQKDAKAYGQCTSLLLEFFFAYAVDTPQKNDEYPILIIADEFSSLPKIPLMNEFLSKGAGMGAIIMIILQDFSQVIEIYGHENFDSMKSNCSYLVIFAQNNLNVQREISAMIGQRTILEKQKDINKKEGLSLIRPEEIGSIPFGKHLLLVANFHNRPIFCNTPLFFKDKKLCKKLNRQPSQRKG